MNKLLVMLRIQIICLICFIVTLLTSGCLHTNSQPYPIEWTVPPGILVTDSTTEADRSVINKVIRRTLFRFDNPKLPKQVQIYLTNDWVQVKLNDEEVMLTQGYSDLDHPNKLLVISLLQACEADSTLVHELGHLLRQVLKMSRDADHKDKDFWDRIRLIEQEVVREFCPAGYVSEDLPPPIK